MKKFHGSLLVLSLFALSCSTLAVAEEAVTDAEMPAPVEDVSVPALSQESSDMDSIKSAWSWLNDNGQADLAAKLEKIVNGDKTDATATLTEAAAAVKEADPVLSTELERIAADWAPKA